MQYCTSTGQEWDATIVQYYERLAQLQAHGETITPQTMQTLFTQIQTSHVPQSLLRVPQSLLRDWAEKVYTNPTDFWAFRMQVNVYVYCIITLLQHYIYAGDMFLLSLVFITPVH